MPELKEQDRRIILDSSAFIAGFDPLLIRSVQYSVPEVEKELIEGSLPWTRLKTALEVGKLKIRIPKLNYFERIKIQSKQAGDLLFLSHADNQVLALALQFKDVGLDSEIVTDDYSIQNVANQLGIKFVPLMTFGIRYHFRWRIYCPACYRKYPADFTSKQCSTCGTQLKRRPIRRTKLQPECRRSEEYSK
ncbi:MAG: NOB1 family endonuclease [Candidatus Bathyarchaeota archaeon]|nr:NOB1 family endonuclease [Candidatus Bathyarchaeota archaeon]